MPTSSILLCWWLLPLLLQLSLLPLLPLLLQLSLPFHAMMYPRGNVISQTSTFQCAHIPTRVIPLITCVSPL